MSYAKGSIALSHSEHVPSDFIRKVKEHAERWTGTSWNITLSEEKAHMSLKESADKATADKKMAMAKHPKVKAILETFPGASIKHIKESESV